MLPAGKLLYVMPRLFRGAAILNFVVEVGCTKFDTGHIAMIVVNSKTNCIVFLYSRFPLEGYLD